MAADGTTVYQSHMAMAGSCNQQRVGHRCSLSTVVRWAKLFVERSRGPNPSFKRRSYVRSCVRGYVSGHGHLPRRFHPSQLSGEHWAGRNSEPRNGELCQCLRRLRGRRPFPAPTGRWVTGVSIANVNPAEETAMSAPDEPPGGSTRPSACLLLRLFRVQRSQCSVPSTPAHARDWPQDRSPRPTARSAP